MQLNSSWREEDGLFPFCSSVHDEPTKRQQLLPRTVEEKQFQMPIAIGTFCDRLNLLHNEPDLCAQSNEWMDQWGRNTWKNLFLFIDVAHGGKRWRRRRNDFKKCGRRLRQITCSLNNVLLNSIVPPYCCGALLLCSIVVQRLFFFFLFCRLASPFNVAQITVVKRKKERKKRSELKRTTQWGVQSFLC